MSNRAIIVQDVIDLLARRYGAPRQFGKAQVFTFGSSLTCSINYSKLLRGQKFFYAIPSDVLNDDKSFPKTEHGEFVVLICGAADQVLVMPREFVLKMMTNVPSRRVDVFLESGSYILQTTKHPKENVSDYLNAYPRINEATPQTGENATGEEKEGRIHVKMQWNLMALGRAEGCGVWVPTNDRNLSYRGQAFSELSLNRLPNFGFDENTRRIVQNIDVLWLAKNVIRKAFEIEATTSVYSGLLRFSDLVLAQPNIKIELYIAAAKSKRDRVLTQLTRPTFHPLHRSCRFLSFESIEESVSRLDGLPKGAHLSGLIQGEQFELPENFVYPEN